MPRNELIWSRIKAQHGGTFMTTTGLPFRAFVDGDALIVSRNGKLINRRLMRNQVFKGVDGCPLQTTRDVQDCLGPSYIFGILMDSRIRHGLW